MTETEKKVFARSSVLTPAITHYCPGCGHGIVHRLVAEVIEHYGIRGRTVGVAPVGCAVHGQQVHRHRHDRGGARPGAGGGHRASSGRGPTWPSSPTRATAIWRPSAPPKSSMRPIAARTSP